MKHQIKKMISVITAIILCLSFIPFSASIAAHAAEQNEVTLKFSDNGISEVISGDGYKIDGNTLKISSPGTYRITGISSEGNIEIAKSTEGVTLILDDLSLTSETTAPVVIKKGCKVTIRLEGDSYLINNEDSADEDTNEDFEGAAIKAKSGSEVTFEGTGSLTVQGNAKNGIKGASETAFYFNSGIYNITAVNNGIASDGSIVIYSGAYNIDTENDGIKSVPDEDDSDSEGSITIYGGTFNIHASGDGIQAETALFISNGTFNIKTLTGYADKIFDKDTMSCKGLKASGDREVDNNLTITAGTFILNTADDAVHSDGDILITGGTFLISSGDDGVHADGTLTLGAENGLERDPEITVNNSYEGLEGANVYIYSGKYYVTASDDGINAAGGSSNGSDPGMGGDSFSGVGGRGGRGGFGGGSGGFGGQAPMGGSGGQAPMGESSDYNIYVYGGDVYVNCDGDGLDSNGGLYLYGGTLSVLSMKGGGDNSPLDADGEVIIDGATIFAAGSAGMERMRQGSGNGSQAVYTSNNQLQAGTVVNIMQGNTLLFSEKLVKNVNYCIFSSPSLTSSASISTSSQITPCSSNAWEHSWDNGVIVTEASETKEGLMVYTCSACGAKEYKTIPKTAAEDTGSITEPVNDPEPEAPSQTDTALVITPDAAEIATGKTLQLTAFSDPSGANVSGLIWSSSDESVAAVDNNGTVTALTYGTAVITAESADGSLKASAVIQTRYYDVAGSPSSSASDYQYYYNAVYWAADSGITKGYGNIYFAPESECTRREMLIFLWRMAGKPVSEDYANPNEVFSDMSNYAPYTDTYRAVSWGISEGIVKGYTDGTFRPDMQVTRKDTLIMLYRMAGKPDVSGQIEYTDVISENYSESSDTYKAILWADQNNITNGYSDGTFRPLDSCLREHIITFLYRYAMMIYK